MMPSDNTPAKPAITKDHENQGSDNGKTTRAQEQGIKCPRCDSPNTKFCYYNNYSLTQPRHFCKTCRRYWTNGGALRNVPIGGGCRKNKKVKTSSSSSSSLSRLSCDSKDSAPSSAELAGLRFFRGINSPSMEFQLGGLPFPHPPITTGIYNQLSSSFGSASSSATSASSFQLDPSGTSDSFIGLNYPFSSSTASGFIGTIQGMNVNNSLASSIESLSSINQDLHWKLQQQRLAMMCGGDNQKDSSSVSLSPVNNLENQTQKPQPILFQNLEISKPEIFQPGGNSRKESPSGDAPSEWFLGNSYSLVTPSTTNSNGANDNDNANNNWSSGVHVWGDVQQPYSILP